MTTAALSTRFSDEHAQRLADIAIAHLRHVVDELLSYNDILIPDEAAQLCAELLAAAGLGTEQPATFVALRVLLDSASASETPEARRQSHLRAVVVAIGLGLHLEENGWIVRILAEDPGDVTTADWLAILDEVNRRLELECAEVAL